MPLTELLLRRWTRSVAPSGASLGFFLLVFVLVVIRRGWGFPPFATASSYSIAAFSARHLAGQRDQLSVASPFTRATAHSASPSAWGGTEAGSLGSDASGPRLGGSTLGLRGWSPSARPSLPSHAAGVAPPQAYWRRSQRERLPASPLTGAFTQNCTTSPARASSQWRRRRRMSMHEAQRKRRRGGASGDEEEPLAATAKGCRRGCRVGVVDLSLASCFAQTSTRQRQREAGGFDAS